jgi:hypothetical protein
MAKIVMPDNQSFPLEDEIANNDDDLRAVLRPAYPDAATALFSRTGGKDGKELVITVIKQSGTKGATGAILSSLLAAQEEMNPAIVMQQQVVKAGCHGAKSMKALLGLKSKIGQAMIDGREEIKAVESVKSALTKADAQPSNTVPQGF